jgi:hypothetical protein
MLFHIKQKMLDFCSAIRNSHSFLGIKALYLCNDEESNSIENNQRKAFYQIQNILLTGLLTY